MQQYRIEIKWGLIFVAMSLLWMLGERLVGLHDELLEHHAVWTNLIAVPAIILYVLALKDKRENFYGGKMSWGQGFKAGMIVTAVVAILSPLTQLITSKIITPHYFDNVIAYSVAQGLSTQADAEAFFNLGNYIVMGFIGAIVMGAVTSAIVAIFAKRG
ncbi:DUF4199 domain-containing protein [Neolewinella lacunae]|uniref:DUF4199 domain-containing protein n=1 Tax=Neolewinella lacunae TaxID=1517758 RepID=A0A923PES2_9BACT|nr:DUF4199 domain-containing protein [Neolewinella lacunae]MBC6992745.1 DUF4199 domain-containing protein [Neolewinella lacunae]MDN3635989.1 DUF4199 domain-containing protein [Neolewinella lacunae]